MQDQNVPGAAGTMGSSMAETPPGPIQRFFLALSLSPRAFRLPHTKQDWAVVLMVVLALHLVSGLILKDQYVEMQIDGIRQGLESRPGLTEEERDQTLEQLTGNPMLAIGPIIGAVVMPVLGVLLGALILLLILNFAMGAQVRFGYLWFLMALSMAPQAVWVLVFTAVAVARGSVDVSFGPAAFLGADTTPLKTFLRTFDIFYLWGFAAQWVGIPVVTGVAPRKAHTALVILWVIFWAFSAVAAILSGLGGRMG